MNANEQKPGQQNQGGQQGGQQNQGGGQGGRVAKAASRAAASRSRVSRSRSPDKAASRVVRAAKADNAKAARVASRVRANVFCTAIYRPRSLPGVFLWIVGRGEAVFSGKPRSLNSSGIPQPHHAGSRKITTPSISMMTSRPQRELPSFSRIRFG